MSSPWVTTQQPAYGEVKPFEWSVLAECFQRILGAGWCETAGCWLEWGDADLIEPDQNHKRKDDCFFYGSDHLAASVGGSITAFHDFHFLQSDWSLPC